MDDAVVDTNWCLSCDTQLDAKLQCTRCRPSHHVLPNLYLPTEASSSSSISELGIGHEQGGMIIHFVVDTNPKSQIHSWLSSVPTAAASNKPPPLHRISSSSSSSSSHKHQTPRRPTSSRSHASYRSTTTSSSSYYGSEMGSEPALLKRQKRSLPTLCMSEPTAHRSSTSTSSPSTPTTAIPISSSPSSTSSHPPSSPSIFSLVKSWVRPSPSPSSPSSASPLPQQQQPYKPSSLHPPRRKDEELMYRLTARSRGRADAMLCL